MRLDTLIPLPCNSLRVPRLTDFWPPLVILLACLAFANAASAQNEVEKRWQERDEAHVAYKSAVETTVEAHRGLVTVDRALAGAAGNLIGQNDAYFGALDRFGGLLKQLEAQYVLRVEADAVPEALSAERRELRRQYDILADYRNYVEDSFFREIEDGIKSRNREIAELRESGRRRIENEIKPEIERLRVQLAEAQREIERLSKVEYDRTLTTQWFNAAQTVHEAEKRQSEALIEVEKAEEAFIKTTAEASPPFLQAVRLTAGGKGYYDFAWVRQGSEDDATASLEYTRERARIIDSLPNYKRVLREVSNDRETLRLNRWKIARDMHVLSRDLTAAAEDYGNAQENKVIALAVTEIAVTLTEVAVTGGVATAVRRGEELAEKAVLSATTGRVLASEAEELGTGVVRVHLKDAVEGLHRARFDLAGKIANQRRLAYIAENAEKEALTYIQRRYGSKFASLTDAATEVPKVTLDRIVRETSSSVGFRAGRMFPEPNLSNFAPPKKLLDTAKDYASDFARYEGVGADGLSPGGVFGKGPDLYAAYADKDARGLVPDAKPTDVGDIFQGQAVEWAIGTGTSGGIELIRHDWSAAATAARSADISKLSAFGKDAAMGAVFSTVEGSAKAIISAYYENEISDAHARFWGDYARLSVMYQYYYHLLKADEELAPIERSYRMWLSRGQAYLAELGVPRRAGGAMPELRALPPEFTTATVELDFSSPLTAPPVVHLGETKLSVQGSGSRWRATIDISLATRRLGRAPLTVAAGQGNQSYADLDMNPGTIAYLPYKEKKWIGYDRGADTRHTIAFEPKTVEITVFDALDKQQNSHLSVYRGTGENKTALFNGFTADGPFDLDPGDYTIYIVDANHARENQERVVTVTEREVNPPVVIRRVWGRLSIAGVFDALGKQQVAHFSIYSGTGENQTPIYTGFSSDGPFDLDPGDFTVHIVDGKHARPDLEIPVTIAIGEDSPVVARDAWGRLNLVGGKAQHMSIFRGSGDDKQAIYTGFSTDGPFDLNPGTYTVRFVDAQGNLPDIDVGATVTIGKVVSVTVPNI